MLEVILSVIPKKKNPTSASDTGSAAATMEEGGSLGSDLFTDPYTPASDIYSLGKQISNKLETFLLFRSLLSYFVLICRLLSVLSPLFTCFYIYK